MEAFLTPLFYALAMIAQLIRDIGFDFGRKHISLMSLLIYMVAIGILVSIIKQINIRQFGNRKEKHE